MIDIDLVYLWVNGNDPQWRAKRDACIGRATTQTENCDGRSADNDELRYSLRSVEKYAPWIRRIFIVTDNQTPQWLDTSHPKIQIVDHKEILPPESLPCFNSVVIEHHLHRIPGLAEHFLYANDDMFLNKPVGPETFFTQDGFPIVRFNLRILKKWHIWYRTRVQRRDIGTYRQTIHNAALLVEKRFGTYYHSKAHHNIDAYLRSHYNLTRQLFKEEIDATLGNHMRSRLDIQRNLYSYVALSTRCGQLKYVNQHTSFRRHIDNRRLYAKFLRFDPVFFCMNDSEYSNDDDRRYAHDFIMKYFPDKSAFEKS